MSEVEWVSDLDEFNKIVEDSWVTVVDFSAPAWCAPCKQLEPHFEMAAESAKFRSDVLGQTKFVAVDVDRAPWAMEEFGIRGVPTVMLFREGEFVNNLKERTVVKLVEEIKTVATS